MSSTEAGTFPFLPRSVVFAGVVGADMAFTSDTINCPSKGGLFADAAVAGVLFGIFADSDPGATTGTASLSIQGSVDGTVWEELDIFVETDFAALNEPALSFGVVTFVPYRPNYRIVSLAQDAANDAVVYDCWIVR